MDLLVQGTNDSSIVSKHSMVQRGYIEDSFIKYFVSKTSRRSPLINMGYYVRSLIIRAAVKFYLDQHFEQVISLGAGFDTIYFTLVSNYKAKHFEIDLQDVVKNKIKCFKNSPEIMKKLQNIVESNSPLRLKSDSYAIIAQDLNDTVSLEKALLELNVDFDKPTVIFSECAIAYMSKEKSTELIDWSARKFKNAVFLNYEQIIPDHGFGFIMKKHFEKIQSPLRSVDDYGTPESQEELFHKCGWKKSRSICAMELFNRLLSVDEKLTVFNLEPFDEWEEWHLTCVHYTLSISLNDVKIGFPSFFTDYHFKEEYYSHYATQAIQEFSVCRFSHCSFLTKCSAVIIGGFGCQETRHGRIKEILLLNLETKEIKTISLETSAILDSLHSTCTKIYDGFLFYGGRTSPLRLVNDIPFLIKIKDNHLEIQEINIKGFAPEPRYRHSCTNFKNDLIVYGGRTSGIQVLGDCWSLKLKECEGNWMKLVPSDIHPGERFSHAASSDENFLFLSGGLDKNFQPLADLWRMNLNSENFACWEKINVELKPRYGHTMHHYSSGLILIGGVNFSVRQPCCTLINLETLLVRNILFRVDELFLFHNHTSEICEEENALYLFGGGGNCFSFGTSFNVNPVKIDLQSFVI